MALDVSILALNVGSTSIRASVLRCADGGAVATVYDVQDIHRPLDEILDDVAGYAPFTAVAHRIVHAGALSLRPAAVIDATVYAAIEAARELAPDHNPAALRTIDQCRARFGEPLLQIAVFDSAFHRTLPAHAYTYPIAHDVARASGIRRYGFHGLSHEYSAQRVRDLDPRPGLRHVSVHIGSGVSAAAIVNGASVDTTMGFTPLDGAMMGTRSGSLDPGILLELQRCGLTRAQLRSAVDGKGGLLGLSGISSDYRTVVQQARAGNADCELAVAVYEHRLAGEIARMAASTGGLDALSFTGGAGEHSEALREQLCARLAFLGVRIDAQKNAAVRDGQDAEIGSSASSVRLFVITADEGSMIASHAAQLLHELSHGNVPPPQNPSPPMDDGWERAKTELKTLQAAMLSADLDSRARHDVRNLLAISQSNLEAVSEGMLPVTPERLQNIEAALEAAAKLLR